MQLKLVLAAVAGAALMGAGGAGAAMHPVLGAKLAGMGEHGVVNLQSDAANGQLCWTFDVMTHGLTRASIRDTAGMVVAKLGPAYKCEELRCRADEGARADRDEARLLPRLGRHEGPPGRAPRHALRRHGAHARRACRMTRAEGRARRLPWHRGRRRLGPPLGEGRLGQAVGAARRPSRRASRSSRPAAGGSTRSPATMPRFDPATWRLAARGPRRAAARRSRYERAAVAAEGRAGLDVPLRDRLDGQERPLGRRAAERRAASSRRRSRRRTRSSSSRPSTRTSTT